MLMLSPLWPLGALSVGSHVLRHAPVVACVCVRVCVGVRTHGHVSTLSGPTRCFGLILRVSHSSPGISQFSKELWPKSILKFLTYVSVLQTRSTWMKWGKGPAPDKWVSVSGQGRGQSWGRRLRRSRGQLASQAGVPLRMGEQSVCLCKSRAGH